MGMNERLGQADLVVYGQIGDMSELPSDTSTAVLLNYTLNVLCVMKKEAGIKQSIGNSIVIHEEYPTIACYSNRHYVVKGRKIVAMLSERSGQTGFYFDNINIQGAVFLGNQSTFDKITVCAGINNHIGSECPQIANSSVTCSTASMPSSYSISLLSFVFLTIMSLYQLLC